MPYFVTKPWPKRHCSSVCLLIVAGCATLTLLDRSQTSAIAQAVSAADFAAPNLAAAPTSSVAQTVLLVDPVAGNDATADGSDRAPFKTVTQALQVAQAGTVILLSPGTYSQETGERFPLRLKPEVTVQGNTETRGQGIVIQGSGFILSPAFARQKVAIVGADRAILAGVTVKNPDPQGYGVWIESTSPAIVDSTFTESGHDGISVMGNGSPLIRNNYFYQNGANGITIYGTSQSEVRENIFEQTGFAININQKATPLLVGNRITQNKDGIVVQASAQPVLQGNSVEGNQRDGLVAIAQARPNLGTAAAPGANSFRNNGQFDVNVKGASQQIPAFGNDVDKISGSLDLAGTSLGAVSPGAATPWAATGSSSGSSRLVALSAGVPSPASADKSTSGSKAPVRAQKSATSASAASQTIPFGQRLEGDRPVNGSAPVALQPMQQSSEGVDRASPGNDISASTFPVPATQPLMSSTRPGVPVVAVAAPASALTDPGFPVPTALSGVSPKPLSRPVQIVRVAVAPPTSAPQAAQPSAPSFSATLPPAVVTPRLSRPIARLPVALNRGSTANLTANLNQPAPLPAQVPLSVKRSGAVEIPVPEPERRSAPRPVVAMTTVTSTQAASFRPVPLTNAGLLPVPDPNAPIGNVGGASMVYRSGSASAAVKLPYRVVVDADDRQQTQLRAAFPNAFRTSIKGRSLIQVGAFGDRAKADQLMQTLSSQGIQARMEMAE
jgi:parallel beta-helix repeat protein